MASSLTRNTRRRIAAARRVEAEELNITWCMEAPHIADPGDLAILRRHLNQERFDLVVFDPFYLLLDGASGISPASMFDMGPVIGRITRLCLDAGATPVFLHHFSRPSSTKHDPPTLEDLAFSGLTQYCRQWLAPPLPSPPMSLNKGHRAMLLAAGHLDGRVCPPGEPPHVVRGTATKQSYVQSVETHEEQDGDVTKTVIAEKIMLTVRVATVDGRILTLTRIPTHQQYPDIGFLGDVLPRSAFQGGSRHGLIGATELMRSI